MELSAIIDLLGGREAVARICGLTENAVYKWNDFGYVPSKHWATLVGASDGRVTYELLAGLRDGTAQPPAPAQEAADG